MNKYEQKQADKKAYYVKKAQELRKEADSVYQQFDDVKQAIPMGQPILVGHYSENRHRNLLKRWDNLLHKSNELYKKAEYYEEKANTVSTAISSDDEDAILKLEKELQGLIKNQERMKAINRMYKKEGDACLNKLDNFEMLMVLENFRSPVNLERKPFPTYELTNNNQNIRRIKQRIETLKRERSMPTQPDIQGDGYILKQDKDDNRILFVFDEKPTEAIRAILKRRGFKWSPSRGAWIRMLNNNGRLAAKRVVDELKQMDG